MSDKNFKVKNGIDANGTITISQPNTSTIPLIIKANTLATGSNMLEMQRPDGTVRFAIGNDGALSVNSNINFNGGNMTMYPGNSGQTALIVNGQTNQSVANLIVKAATNQSGNLQEWRDQSNNLAVSIGPDFALRGIAGGFFGTANGNIVGVNYLGVKGWAANHIPFVVQGVTSQTGDLTRWVDSSANTLAKVDASGSITAVDLTLSGNLTVNGTTTNLNSTNLVIEDKNIILADVATPTDTTADGAGITIKGATDKTFSWVQSSGRFVSSEPVQSSAFIGTSNIYTPQLGSTVIGSATLNTNADTGGILINTAGASNKGFIVKGAASQTANLQEWQNNSGTILNSISASGTLNINTSGTGTINLGDGVLIKGPGNGFTFNSDVIVLDGKGVEASSGKFTNVTGISTVPLIVKAISGQTANIQEWQSSDGTVLSTIGPNGTVTLKSINSANIATFTNGTSGYGAGSINASGTFNINGANLGFPYTASGAVLSVNATSAGGVAITARGYASQTADLQQWQNNAGTTLSKVDSSGNITAPSYNLSDSKYLLRKTIKKTVDPAQNALANNTYNLFDMNFSSSLQGTFYIQASIRGGGYGQNLTYSLPATYVMDWINQYAITNPFTDSTTWVDLTPLTFSPRHLMTNDYFKFQAKVNANQISFRIKLTGTLTGAPVFDIYIQHSEEFVNSTITELNTTGTDATTSNVMPNFLSSKAGLSAIFNPITLYSNNSTNIPLFVRGAASQTANLQEWQNSSGTVLAEINSYGGAKFIDLKINTTSSLGSLGIVTGTTTQKGIVVRGIASQTANLQEWQNSSAATLASIGSAGGITVESGNSWLKGGTRFSGNYGGSQTVLINNDQNIIALNVKGNATQTADLQQWQNNSATVLAKVDANGNFSAISKSFDIPHPTKENMRLRYASLEGPENGVYIRGTVESNIIELPEYWTGLVHEDSITVSLTAVGSAQNIYVEKIENNKVYIGGEFTKAFFTVYGERKDIDKLTVEY